MVESEGSLKEEMTNYKRRKQLHPANWISRFSSNEFSNSAVRNDSAIPHRLHSKSYSGSSDRIVWGSVQGTRLPRREPLPCD